MDVFPSECVRGAGARAARTGLRARRFGVAAMAEDERYGPQGIWAAPRVGRGRRRGRGRQQQDHGRVKDAAGAAGAEEAGPVGGNDGQGGVGDGFGSDGGGGDADGGGDDNGVSGIDNEALRAYELRRLRYYFAVATFDSPATATAVCVARSGICICRIVCVCHVTAAQVRRVRRNGVRDVLQPVRPAVRARRHARVPEGAARYRDRCC